MMWVMMVRKCLCVWVSFSPRLDHISLCGVKGQRLHILKLKGAKGDKGSRKRGCVLAVGLMCMWLSQLQSTDNHNIFMVDLLSVAYDIHLVLYVW